METTAAADAVKAALTSGSASSSTVTTLQTFLCEVSPRPTSAKTAPASTTTARRGTAKRAPTQPARATQAARGRKAPEVQVLEDVPTALPPKARYALATDIVNITLKVLADATKAGPKQPRRRSSVQGHATPARTATPHKALQLRSANATPVPAPADKNSRSQRRPSSSSVASISAGTSHLGCVAECASLAFSCLRSSDVKRLGLRELPPWQLENGMLSLCGKLLSLRLRTLAAKQLRIVKHSLETGVSPVPDSKPGTAASSKLAQDACYSSLLRFRQDSHARPSMLPTLISYQLHVMQLLVLVHDGSAIEKVVDLLTGGTPESPSGTILRHVEGGADSIKAAKQLETLSRTMLQLCPSVSTAADEQSRDRALYPAPLSVFRLQVASLSLQQQSQRLANRPQDVEKDIIEPFSRCLSTLLRRASSRSETTKLLETCTASYRALDLKESDMVGSTGAGFNILMTLSRISQLAESYEQAKVHAEMALKQCNDLERSHARYVAASIRLVYATSSSREEVSDRTSAQQDLDAITKSLHRNLSGNLSDYEMLLLELAQVVRILPRGARPLEEQRHLLCAAAAFSSRYVRVSSEKHLETAQEIVHLALSGCGSSEDATSWVTRDTASVMIKSGAFRRLAGKASSSSLALVCRSSGTAIAFGRIIKILISKAVTSGSEKSVSYIVETDHLEPAERGLLLEWQLKCSLDLVHKPKYRQTVSKLIQELVRRLAKTYDVAIFPLRRARTSALVLRARQEYPEILPPHTVAALGRTTLDDVTDLGKDEGLQCYLPDLRATLDLSRAFCDGRPSVQQLHTILDVWKPLLEKSAVSADIDAAIDSPSMFAGQLISIEEYLGMIGDNALRLTVSDLLAKYTKLCGTVNEQCSSATKVARAYMARGCAEDARDVLRAALHLVEGDGNTPSLDLIECQLATAESMLLLDQLPECREALAAAHQSRQNLPPHAITPAQSQRYKMIHGRAWLMQSRFLMASGSPQDALRAAKQASKVMNSIWAGLERNDQSTLPRVGMDGKEPSEPPVDALTAKVSKLNLKPTASGPNSKKTEPRGAAFWPVVRLSCQSSMHLADIYAHHGIYNEANHASEQALKTAEAVGSQGLLLDVRAHRSLFLALAGRFEDSELCLEQEGSSREALPSLASIGQSRAKAAACAQRGEPNTAVVHLKEAEETMKLLLSQHVTLTMTEKQSQDATEPTAAKSKTSEPAKPVFGARTATTSRVTAKKPVKSRAGTVRPVASSAAVTGPTTKAEAAMFFPYMLRKIQAEIAFLKAAIEVKYGGKGSVDIQEMEALYAGLCHGPLWRSLEQDVLLSKTIKAIQSDFSLSVLTESVLSYPALQRPNSIEESTTPPTARVAAKSLKTVGGVKKTTSKSKAAANPLSAVTNRTAEDEIKSVLSTIEAHERHDLLSTTCMITSATSTTSSRDIFGLTQSLSSIEQGRIHASQSITAVACLERDAHSTQDSLAWPNQQVLMPSPSLTSAQFRSEYIDVLPRSWTAISMCLSESCEELYIARYHGAQPPLVLRIPFSRQKSDEAEEESFLFEDGKSELDDIVSLSNFSCQNNLDVSVKGAKTNWWAEREALDRRLHGLLINMENLWLGGFRGILSQHGRDQEQLDRFRKAFEAMLDRHLPSRQGSKRASKKLVLDDQILELFIGLGTDQDGEQELDELLAELLYFVVDILQFNGERNAYDEVDVDRMVLDVLDAMRCYHDAIDEKDVASHLILVLDRRLQAFPWESLPCLENVSVSRMDSMHSLRERITAMRQQTQISKSVQEDRYVVSRSSGTYILNAGGDLTSTESTLAPELSQLVSAQGANWKSIVRQAPSEDEFKSALCSSSMLLYFGHGAGSQYIRPRAIRRLEKCSEVVWLMGCSSGAVTEYGKLEAFAVPLTYMLAGGQAPHSPNNDSTQPSAKCMAVVATLWDVTDKDIDRFSLAVGEDWGLWKAPPASIELPVKTPRKREKVVAPCTPEKTCKNPKTPRVKKTPVPPKTPVRSRGASRERGHKKMSLVEAVARNRDACYLRYLNGAAPVVYGIPVWLGD